MKLTELQQSIVKIEEQTEDRKTACLASAGSGKSTVIENRVYHLVKNKKVKPEKITLFSFSRAATKEIRGRLKDKLGSQMFKKLNISTIHSFCYHIIREHYTPGRITEINVMANAQLAKAVDKMIGNAYPSDSYFDANSEEYMKELSDSLKQNRKPDFSPMYRDLHDIVEEWMRERDLYLFDHLLYMTYELFQQKPELRRQYQSKYDYWFIDEAQDTTKIMIDIVELLMKDDTYLFMSFDIVQSLYQFAGADPFNLMAFVDRIGAEIVQLDETFRFGPTIAELADMIVETVDLDERYKMKTKTRQMSNTPLYIPSGSYQMNKVDIADDIQGKINDGVNLKDITVLSRTNKPLVEYQKELAKRGIPSQMKFGYIWNRKEIKLLFTLVRLFKKWSPEDLIYVTQTLPGTYGIDRKRIKMMRREYRSDDVVDFLSHFITHKVKGIGDATRSGIARLTKTMESAKTVIEEGDPEMFKHLAETVEMGDCDFMKGSYNEEGGSNAGERWEFVSILDEFRSDNEVEPFEVEAAIKIEFTTESESEEKEAVQLKTIHSSKGETLPYIYMLADTFNSRFIKDEDSLRSELFVLYVAVTRTKTELQIWGELIPHFAFLEETEMEIIASEEELEERAERKPVQMGATLLDTLKKDRKFVNNYNPLRHRPFTSLEAKAQTEMAVLMKVKTPQGMTQDVWLPKSQLGYNAQLDSFAAPEWLHRKIGL